MRKDSPEQLCLDIMRRSIRNVQVGAVIFDRHGIISWGWNHDKGGVGCHAEIHAIGRANPARLDGSTIIVAGRWRDSGNLVDALPCEECQSWINKFSMKVVRRTKGDEWK